MFALCGVLDVWKTERNVHNQSLLPHERPERPILFQMLTARSELLLSQTTCSSDGHDMHQKNGLASRHNDKNQIS